MARSTFTFRRLIRVVGSFVVVAALAVPAMAADDNKKANLIKGSGSDTTYNVMVELDQAYNNSKGCYSEAASGQPVVLNHTCARPDDATIPTTENYDHDVALQMFPIGSSNGISQLCQRGLTNVSLIDYARSSRSPRTTDCAGLRFVAFARDALPWASFQTGPSAGVTELTQAEIKGIFVTCTITNWSQIGGTDAPIIVYAAQAGSGTRSTFDSFIGGSSESCIPADKKSERVVFENNASLIKVADRPTAIFYYSFGRFQITGGETSKLGCIDNVCPTKVTIGDGSFPYNRLLYNVYRATFPTKNASEATKEYMSETGWICKANSSHSNNPSTGKNYGEEIATIIDAAGLVTLPEGAIGGGVTGTSKCRVTSY